MKKKRSAQKRKYITRESKKRKDVTGDANRGKNVTTTAEIHLPVELMAKILSPLRTKAIKRLTLCSKGWMATIKRTDFSDFLSTNAPYSTFYCTKSMNVQLYADHLLEICEDGNCFLTHFNSSVLENCLLKIVGLCNSFLCIQENSRDGLDKIYIYNPITNECVEVNASPIDKFHRESHYYFGYSRAQNQYKVFRFRKVNKFTRERDDSKCLDDYHVLTVGIDESWRELSPEMFDRHMRLQGHVPSYNGALCWIVGKKSEGSFIMALDVSEETMRRISFPEVQWEDCMRLMTWTDHLCLIPSEFPVLYKGSEIWMMSGDGREWTRIELPRYVCRPVGSHWYSQRSLMPIFCSTKQGGLMLRGHPVGGDCLYDRRSMTYTPTTHGSYGYQQLFAITPYFGSINDIIGNGV